MLYSSIPCCVIRCSEVEIGVAAEPPKVVRINVVPPYTWMSMVPKLQNAGPGELCLDLTWLLPYLGSPWPACLVVTPIMSTVDAKSPA